MTNHKALASEPSPTLSLMTMGTTTASFRNPRQRIRSRMTMRTRSTLSSASLPCRFWGRWTMNPCHDRARWRKRWRSTRKPRESRPVTRCSLRPKIWHPSGKRPLLVTTTRATFSWKTQRRRPRTSTRPRSSGAMTRDSSTTRTTMSRQTPDRCRSPFHSRSHQTPMPLLQSLRSRRRQRTHRWLLLHRRVSHTSRPRQLRSANLRPRGQNSQRLKALRTKPRVATRPHTTCRRTL